MGDSVASGLRFADLGPLVIERAGVSEPVRGRRVTAALALLLVRANQHVSVDALVDAVWEGAPSDGAASTLDSHVWRLRRMLEPDRRRGEPFTTITHDGEGFRLAVTGDQVDSLRFAQLAGEARDLLLTNQPGRALARCDDALGRWRGRPWSPHTDEEWAMSAVARLHEIRDQVREHRIDALLQLGQSETVLADIGPLLAAAPLRERLWGSAMLAAYRTGRIDEALETYRRARRTLIEETGLEPGAELRDLHTRILDRDTDLAGPTSRSAPRRPELPSELHLPDRRTDLVGRAQEVERLVEAVTTRALVTIVGSAGCGKTRLSIEVARRAAPSFPDGVWFVDLNAAEDPDQLLDVIASSLGMAAPDVGTVADALRAFTRSRRMLIVLDNCEHILDAAADHVDQLLGPRSELSVLATSREPLDLDDEHVWALGPLSIRSATQSATESPAVQLFLQRLAVAAPQWQPRPHDIDLAADICEQVDGLPLAIELAAGQARSFTLAEIAERVRTDLATLSRVGRGGNRHHATLRGAIELSTATLNPTELAVHHAVAVVPGPFTAELAAHLAGISGHHAATALAGLVHRSLLTPLGPLRAGGPSRFAQLATVRAHGLSSAPDLRTEASRRRDEWASALVLRVPPVGDPAELTWHAEIDDDYPSIRAALQHCLVDEPHPMGAEIAARLALYWFYRGMSVEWRRWVTVAHHGEAADPYDQLLVDASHASIIGLAEGADLCRAWMDDLVGFPYPLDRAQTCWLGQYLPAISSAAWLTGAIDVCRRASAWIRDTADQTGEPQLDLFAHVTALLTLDPNDPSTALAIEDCYQRADAADNFYARWMTDMSGVIAGLSAGSPELGLHWSDRQLREFARLGFEANVPGLEMRGTLQMMAGQAYQAIRTLAVSKALARRFGLRWPSMESTPELLTTAQSMVSSQDADNAYREGTLGLVDFPESSDDTG